MSKQYTIDMKLDISGLSENSGILMKQVDVEVNKSGFEKRTGAEVFAFLCSLAVQGANPKVSFGELKGFREIVKLLTKSAEIGSVGLNKTQISVLKNSIRGNMNWPNSDEMFDILEKLMEKLNINENPAENT